MNLYEEEIIPEKNILADQLHEMLCNLSKQANIKIIEEDVNNLGIPSNSYIYHQITDCQLRKEEYQKTLELIEYVKKKYDFSSARFINYGDTELIFVVEKEGELSTLSVGQPRLNSHLLKVEYDNLQKLAIKNNNLVVRPTDYIQYHSREAFISPYLKQARCIATFDGSYGSYVPEPYYRFRPFTEEGRNLINQLMIANLVKTYNEEEQLALADCKIGGGDFILDHDTDTLDLTIDHFLSKIHLIAARKLISIDFRDYLNLIRKEFRKVTYYSDLYKKDPNIIINDKNRVAMTDDEIESGIQLGLTLRRFR